MVPVLGLQTKKGNIYGDAEYNVFVNGYIFVSVELEFNRLPRPNDSLTLPGIQFFLSKRISVKHLQSSQHHKMRLEFIDNTGYCS